MSNTFLFPDGKWVTHDLSHTERWITSRSHYFTYVVSFGCAKGWNLTNCKMMILSNNSLPLCLPLSVSLSLPLISAGRIIRFYHRRLSVWASADTPSSSLLSASNCNLLSTGTNIDLSCSPIYARIRKLAPENSWLCPTELITVKSKGPLEESLIGNYPTIQQHVGAWPANCSVNTAQSSRTGTRGSPTGAMG